MNGIMTVEATISNLNPKAAKMVAVETSQCHLVPGAPRPARAPPPDVPPERHPILALSKSDIPCRIACETRYTLPRPLPGTARNHDQLKLCGIGS